MLSPTPLRRCRRRTGFACASISTTSAAPPNWPTMAGHSTHRPRRRPISPRRLRSARQAVSGSTCCATWRTGSNTAGKVARTGCGSKPPAANQPPSSPPRAVRFQSPSGWTEAVRPSTAPPEQVRGRAQDEVFWWTPSTTNPHPEQRCGEAAARVEGRKASMQRFRGFSRPPTLTSDDAAVHERETGDVVGLLGAGGKFGGGSDDFLDELGGADAPLAIEDCFEPRFAENVSGRVERLGDAVGEHEQRITT